MEEEKGSKAGPLGSQAASLGLLRYCSTGFETREGRWTHTVEKRRFCPTKFKPKDFSTRPPLKFDLVGPFGQVLPSLLEGRRDAAGASALDSCVLVGCDTRGMSGHPELVTWIGGLGGERLVVVLGKWEIVPNH